MQLFLLTAFAASAAAFAPASQSKSSSALSADFSKEVGSQAPVRLLIDRSAQAIPLAVYE
jgi:hypothetical protein